LPITFANYCFPVAVRPVLYTGDHDTTGFLEIQVCVNTLLALPLDYCVCGDISMLEDYLLKCYLLDSTLLNYT